MHGKQLGWVCLASCGADVTINAMVIAWVSGGQEPRFQRCQHNCSGSIPAHATPDSLGPQSPLPKAGKWRGRHDDINWGDPLGLDGGRTKLSGQGEWSPSAKLEFDFGRRGSAAGLLAPGSGDSVVGPLQEPKSPPLAVPRSGLPFSLPKVTEHTTSENIGVDTSAPAPGHAVFHLPLPSPRFGRQNQLARSASQLSESTPPSTRSISLPPQPDSTPGAGPSSGRHHKSRKRSISKYGQETVFTQGTSQTRSGGPASPRRSAADEGHGVRSTLMRGLSVLGLGHRSSVASDGTRTRPSRRGRSRDAGDWTMSVQEKMTQGTATTDISTIVFRHTDSQFDDASTIDSTDTDYCGGPSPCSRPGSLHPWEEESQRTIVRIDERPSTSGDDSEPGCLADVEKAVPLADDTRRHSSEGPPPYQAKPDTQAARDS
ncbi:hypothetical protein FRC00_007382 [Tulasnella sp. 408]|nr:hypothetical protein FRC00_007382 [Tulasnella sp. 408]